jgi:hypothetical protein
MKRCGIPILVTVSPSEPWLCRMSGLGRSRTSKRFEVWLRKACLWKSGRRESTPTNHYRPVGRKKMIDFTYTSELKARFGAAWVGPAVLPHGDWVPVARGRKVEVLACAMPAVFYRLIVRPETTYDGKLNPGVCLSTGSSAEMDVLVVSMMEAIENCMLGALPYDPPEKEASS